MYKKKYKNGSLHVLAKMFNYEKEYLEKLGIIRVHGAKPFTMQRETRRSLFINLETVKQTYSRLIARPAFKSNLKE